jgi:hypothetical protein
MVFSERENSLMSFSKFPLSAMLFDLNARKEGKNEGEGEREDRVGCITFHTTHNKNRNKLLIDLETTG